MSGVIVFCKEVKGIFQSFPATTVDVTIQTPRCPRVIKAWPDGSHCNLMGILGLHLVVEVAEIFATPVTAIRRPALRAGMHPRVAAIKSSPILGRGVVFVQQDCRRFPPTHHLANVIPISIAPLWKDEDDRASFIQQVSIAAYCARTDVLFVCNVQGFQRIFGGMSVVFLSLVIHEC